jgi:hypothetical protein
MLPRGLDNYVSKRGFYWDLAKQLDLGRSGLILLTARIQMPYFYVYKLLISTIDALLIKG